MVKIEVLLRKGIVGRIGETELERYISFFRESCEDNARHAEANMASYPRWSIISGYYAMHDISKLAIAKIFRLKIQKNVHETTIEVISELLKDSEMIRMLQDGFEAFQSLAQELSGAKKERVKVQYYTGTPFMKERYQDAAKSFLQDTVLPFLDKMKKLMSETSKGEGGEE